MSDQLIIAILKSLYPETTFEPYISKKQFIDIPSRSQGIIEQIVLGKSKLPLVFYDFDNIEPKQKNAIASPLNLPGIYYVKLPCPLKKIEKVVQEAANFKIPKDRSIYEKIFRQYAIKKIRTFKHHCDNVWMAMEGNANSARNDLKAYPEDIPEALTEFNKKRIEDLNDEYIVVNDLICKLNLEKSANIPNIFKETIGKAIQIEKGKISADEAIELLAECAGQIKSISKILSKVKEIEING